MQFLRDLCPTADEIALGVYMGTGIETAFLLSYPKARSGHPDSKITIEVSRNHAVLIVETHTADAMLADTVVYDPISVALGRDMREDPIEVVEEANFAEWWSTNLLLGWQHPSTDYIAGITGCADSEVGKIERMHNELVRLRTLREGESDPVEHSVSAVRLDEHSVSAVRLDEQHVLLQGETAFGSAGLRRDNCIRRKRSDPLTTTETL